MTKGNMQKKKKGILSEPQFVNYKAYILHAEMYLSTKAYKMKGLEL